jgi:hypothetical protein
VIEEAEGAEVSPSFASSAPLVAMDAFTTIT